MLTTLSLSQVRAQYLIWIECQEQKFPLSFKSIVPVILAEPLEEYLNLMNDIL